MSTAVGRARFRAFTAALTRHASAEAASEPAMIAETRRLLAELVAADDWLPEGAAAPDRERYRQYLLHCDPLERFSVVSFVWGPGQATPIHNHTVWGVIGMLRGAENCEPFTRTGDGGLVAGPAEVLRPGDLAVVSPSLGDVHRVANALANRPSVSIHVYGGNIGRVRRHVFKADGTVVDFVSGYASDAVPNWWVE
jgi:predicted metal-dependent enzyme (double-stranded beta helix superfamily)